MKINDRQLTYLEIAALVFISALAYLLLVNRLGYYKDDWYLMYLAHSQGPSIFKDIFAIDRPARGVLLQFLYSIFGDRPLYYNLTSYLFRLLSSIGFLWALRLLWPRQRTTSFIAALLFLIYPGYLSQVNAIDYQSYTLSLCLAMFSIALTFKAVQVENNIARLLLGALSILLGWCYLGLVEYFIGFEVFRFAGLLLLTRWAEISAWRSTTRNFIWKASPFVSIPLIFLLWRIFIFQNERKATSVSAQLGRVITLPSLTSADWLFSLARDTVNVIFSSWFVPLYNLTLASRLRDMLFGLLVAALAALAVWWILRRHVPDDTADETWHKQSMLIGLLSILAALLPIILSNRYVDFGEYSRYALPAAVGGLLVLVGLIYYVPEKIHRLWLIAALVFIAAFVQYVNGANAARETAAVNRFWWQVSWRAPQIAKGTTLLVDYSAGAIPEDYVVWGPANLVYYPQAHPERPVNTDISAALPLPEIISYVLAGFGNDSDIGRSTISLRDYRKILVLTQPTASSCVHVLDGKYAELSVADDPEMMLLAPHSVIETILPNDAPHTPPRSIFGEEPEKAGWCFYYQKASLARQQGNWNAVAQFGKEVAALKLHPNDQIEWMPFLQAAAVLDDQQQVKQIASRINVERFYRQQACQNLKAMSGLSASMQSYITETFCD